jgi:hypothetical protein
LRYAIFRNPAPRLRSGMLPQFEIINIANNSSIETTCALQWYRLMEGHGKQPAQKDIE